MYSTWVLVYVRGDDATVLRVELSQLPPAFMSSSQGRRVEPPDGRRASTELVLGTSTITEAPDDGWALRMFSHDPGVPF